MATMKIEVTPVFFLIFAYKQCCFLPFTSVFSLRVTGFFPLHCAVEFCYQHGCHHAINGGTVCDPLIGNTCSDLFRGNKHRIVIISYSQVQLIFLQYIPWFLRMSRPGEKITRKTIMMQKKMKEMEQKEISSKSLLANVLDIDDNFRSSTLPHGVSNHPSHVKPPLPNGCSV